MKLTVRIEQTLEGDTPEEIFWKMGGILGSALVKQFGRLGDDYEKNVAHLNEVKEATLIITNTED